MPSPPKTPYEEIQHENQALEHRFRIYGGADDADNSIELLVPGRTITGKVSATGARKIKLEKVSIYEEKDAAAGKQKKLAVVNKDGEYQTAIWTTTPAHVQQALRAGFFGPQAIKNPIARMIAQIGQYKQHVFAHVTMEGRRVPQYTEKMFIADTTQDCLAALHALHASINNYNEALSPRSNLRLIVDKLDALIAQLEIMIERSKIAKEPYRAMRAGLEQLKKDTEKYRENLRLFKKNKEVTREDLVDYIQRPFGVARFWEKDLHIQHFLQQQINAINSFSIGANNTITRAKSSLMGSDHLGHCLLEARFTGEKFSNNQIDYHNPVTAEHAYDFSGQASADGLVTIDTEKFGFKPKNELDLVKGLDQLQQIDSGEDLLSRMQGARQLHATGQAFKMEIARLAGNFLKDIVGFAADVGYGLYYSAYRVIYRGMLKKQTVPRARFPSYAKILHKRPAGADEYQGAPSVAALADKVARSTRLLQPSFAAQIFKKLYRVAQVLIAEPVTHLILHPLAKLLQGDIFGDEGLAVAYDWRAPLQEREFEQLLDLCIEKDKTITQDNAVVKAAFIADYNAKNPRRAFNAKAATRRIDQYRDTHYIQQACVPYHLTPDDPSDTFSWGTNDFMRELVELFSQDIYRRHPLAGLAFSAAASTAAAPMLFPALGSNFFLHLVNMKIGVPLTKTLVGADTTGVMPAFSTGLLTGKLAYLAVDLANGKNSHLVRLLSAIAENPLLAAAALTATISFGNAIAYKMHVPVLSAALHEEATTARAPYFELGLTGTKIAVVIIENVVHLKQDDHTPLATPAATVRACIEANKAQIMDDLIAGYKRDRNKEELNDADLAILDNMYSLYCDNFTTDFLKVDWHRTVRDVAQELAGEDEEAIAEGSLVEDKEEKESKEDQASDALKTKAKIIDKIAQLNPAALSTTSIRQVMDYVRVNFAEDADYVAAVYRKLNPEKELAPLFGSIKIALSYVVPVLTLRPLLSLLQWGYYAARPHLRRWPWSRLNAQQRKIMTDKALLARARGRDFLQKALNDSGRLVKGVATVLRKSWDFVGSIIHNVLEVMLAAIPRWSTGKARSELSRGFFAPGMVSSALDTAVGYTRASAGVKNLSVASRDALLRAHFKEKVGCMGEQAAGSGSTRFNPLTISGGALEHKAGNPSNVRVEMKKILELDRIKGHAWQKDLHGMRWRTFPLGMDAGKIGQEIHSSLQAAPVARPSKVVDKVQPLLPNQTRAKELLGSRGSKAIVIENLTEDKELVSEMIMAGQFNEQLKVEAMYKQLQSGLEEYLRQHKLPGGSLMTVTMDSSDPDLQRAYILCCIRLGCRCCDKENNEVYRPGSKQIQLGAHPIPLQEFQQQEAARSQYLAAIAINPPAVIKHSSA